jgi:dolichol-phosphate mannosyltransferase
MAKVLVNIATYNEIENLPALVGEIFKYLPEADILVVDDNSPDGTGKWAKEQEKLNPKIYCIEREKKSGLGTAIISGMKYAIENGYEYMVNMDADFSHQPRFLPSLVNSMDLSENGPKDVILGSRYILGGKTENWPVYRKVISRSINFCVNVFLRLRAKDCSGGFRCYRTSLLKKINFEKIISKGYSFQEEILWHLKKQGGKFKEIPITFVERKKGKSKADFSEALEVLKIIFKYSLI